MADYHIKHITRYTYASTVIDCSNQIMLYPLNDSLQIVKTHELKITNDPIVEIFTDFFENKIGVFSVVAPHNELTIQSDIVVSTTPVINPLDEILPALQWEELSKMCGIFPYMDFMHREKFAADEEIQKLLSGIVDIKKSPLVNANILSEYVYNNFEYKKGVTNIETKVDEILKLKAGVCQDFAHVLLVMLHMIGIPARYVSGYICPKDREMRGEGATHAWVEAYIPFFGWLGLDPTNNCIVSDRHVRLAIGRNFSAEFCKSFFLYSSRSLNSLFNLITSLTIPLSSQFLVVHIADRHPQVYAVHYWPREFPLIPIEVRRLTNAWFVFRS